MKNTNEIVNTVKKDLQDELEYFGDTDDEKLEEMIAHKLSEVGKTMYIKVNFY